MMARAELQGCCGAHVLLGLASLSLMDGERVLGTSTKGGVSRDRLYAAQRGVTPVLVYIWSTHSAHQYELFWQLPLPVAGTFVGAASI